MKRDMFNKNWITQNSIEEISNYADGVLTLRGLHYRLVSRGMHNTMKHYKRVVDAMITARWEGLVSFETFSDHDRQMLGNTDYEETTLDESIEAAKSAIKNWIEYHIKNRWENQPYYPEIFIEKKALQGVFEPISRRNKITLGACKGYPSLTFLNEAAYRFNEAIDNGKKPVILYFGDYDPSGEDIPRSIHENLFRMMGVNIEIKRIALLEHQVIEWKLPHAPAKSGDSRTAKWDGIGQVELDAVEPNKIQSLCQKAIDDIFDYDLYEELKEQENIEQKTYQKELKTFVKSL